MIYCLTLENGYLIGASCRIYPKWLRIGQYHHIDAVESVADVDERFKVNDIGDEESDR